MAYRKLGIMRSLFLNKVLESANLQNLQNFEATENYLNQFFVLLPTGVWGNWMWMAILFAIFQRVFWSYIYNIYVVIWISYIKYSGGVLHQGKYW